MPLNVEIFGGSIIAVGDFNPAIVSPDWLERNSLLGKDDADSARADTNLIVSHQISNFETDWFTLQVTEQQLSLNSKGALLPMIKDLAIGIFTLLPHIPVRAIGLNFSAHYKSTNHDDYHKIGDVLAPKDIWNSLYPDDSHSAGLENLTISISPYKRKDKPTTKDITRIIIQPSKLVNYGIFFSINNHFDVEQLEPPTPKAELVVNAIKSHWDQASIDASATFEKIINRALGI